MKCKALLTLAAGLFLAADAPGEDPIKVEKKRFEGTWSLVALEVDGQPVTLDVMKEARLVVAGDRYSFQYGTARMELRHRVDPGRTPKAIDLVITDGKDEGKVYRGIYELNGGRLKICRSADPGNARPTRFATEPGSGLMLIEWKRDTP